jgi:glycosyltransferase involved in cell wall biosynthesis
MRRSNRKVILIGDYSGLHLQLFKGLKNLGVNVKFIGYRNGWRDNEVDIALDSPYRGFIGKIHANLTPILKWKHLVGGHVVQFVSVNVFNTRFGITKFLVAFIAKFNKRVYLLGAGCVSRNVQLYKTHGSNICHGCLRLDQRKKTCRSVGERSIDNENIFHSAIHGYIPIVFDYQYTDSVFCDSISKSGIVPIPIHMADLDDLYTYPVGKIHFFHGISRSGFKGSDSIVPALQSLKSKYPELVEVTIVEKLPYNEYISKLRSADVIVDQLYGFGLGMNALFSMAMGKLVVTSDPSKTYDQICPGEEIPIISTGFNSILLKEKLEWIVQNKENAFSIAKNARKFIVAHHDSEKVAKQYLDIWKI